MEQYCSGPDEDDCVRLGSVVVTRRPQSIQPVVGAVVAPVYPRGYRGGDTLRF